MYCSNCGQNMGENDKYCSKCGSSVTNISTDEEVQELTEKKEEKEDANKANSVFNNPQKSQSQWGGCLGCFGLILLVIILFSSCVSNSSYDSKPSYYKTGNPKDMTNKEMEDFLKWKIKKEKKEWDNAPFGQ